MPVGRDVPLPAVLVLVGDAKRVWEPFETVRTAVAPSFTFGGLWKYPESTCQMSDISYSPGLTSAPS